MDKKQENASLMRLVKPLAWLGGLSALTVALTFGCSDSNTPTGSTKPMGNVNDSSFQLVSNQFSPSDISPDGLDWVGLLVGDLTGTAPSSPNGGLRPFLARRGAQVVGDTLISDSIVIDSTSGWIEFHAMIVSFQDTFTVIDSMRFRDLTNTPFIPSDTLNPDSLNGLDIRIHGSVIATDMTDFVGTAQIHTSLTADIIGRDPLGGLDTIQISATETDTLNGTVIDSASGQCAISASMTASLTNLVGLIDDSTDACPLSGQASVTATIDVSCVNGADSASFNDTWTITATFNGGADANIVFENSTTRWVTTEPCNDNPPPAASSFRRKTRLASAIIE